MCAASLIRSRLDRTSHSARCFWLVVGKYCDRSILNRVKRFFGKTPKIVSAGSSRLSMWLIFRIEQTDYTPRPFSNLNKPTKDEQTLSHQRQHIYKAIWLVIFTPRLMLSECFACFCFWDFAFRSVKNIIDTPRPSLRKRKRSGKKREAPSKSCPIAHLVV